MINLCKNLIAFVALILTLIFFGTFQNNIEIKHAIMLLLSGVVGIGLADSLFFKSLKEVGAGWIAIVECLYSPSVIFCAWMFLEERLSLVALGGGVLILIGLCLPVVSKEKLSITNLQAKRGLFYGSIAMILMALAITSVKPILEQYSVLHSATLRIAGGLLFLIFQMFYLEGKKLPGKVKHTFSTIGKSLIPASLMGSYLAYMFWIAGFKYISASKAALLNQSSTIFIIILAYIFLKEPIHRIKIISVLLAIIGTLMVLL